ncbi:MAG: M67 family metallopeptidase [Lachnospiraceae bacterium]|nr:M67 family metallopeptidase [Lachnospiraceae bacterium]
MKITIQRSEYEKMLAHARNERPNEACGLIAGRDVEGVRQIVTVYLLTNIDHTNEHFSIDPREQLLAIKQMRKDGLVPLGNWHSHPETPARPSEEDKRLANDSKASYLILSLAQEDHPVLHAFHVEGAQGEKTVRKEELIIVEEAS